MLRLIRSDQIYRKSLPARLSRRGRSVPHRQCGQSVRDVRTHHPLGEFALRSLSPRGRGRSAIPEAAKRGEILFFLDYGGPSCFRCHGGFNFSDAVSYSGQPLQKPEFHNTGLYNLAGLLSYPAPNTGLFEHTKAPADVGKFKAPTLRNIAVTAPYMHDGSIATLGEVVDHYSAGGRTIESGPLAGVGRDNPAKDRLVHGFPMTPQNRADLIAFLGKPHR